MLKQDKAGSYEVCASSSGPWVIPLQLQSRVAQLSRLWWICFFASPAVPTSLSNDDLSASW